MLLLRGTKNPFNASRREWGTVSILTDVIESIILPENFRCFEIRSFCEKTFFNINYKTMYRGVLSSFYFTLLLSEIGKVK